MNINVKNGKRTVKLSARERRTLQETLDICHELDDLADGHIQQGAHEALGGLLLVLHATPKPAEPTTTDTEPGESHVIEEPQQTVAAHPQSGRYRIVCDKCGEELTGDEARAGRATCYKCKPLEEHAA